MRNRLLAGVALATLALGACADAPARESSGPAATGSVTDVGLPSPGGCAGTGPATTVDAGDGRDWCLAREGAAPDVSFTLVVDGDVVARMRHDACSWPNAGRTPAFVSFALAEGGTATWGELPAQATGARVTLADGRAVQARSVRVDAGDGVNHFLVVSASGGKAESVAPVGGSGAGPVKVPACDAPATAAGVAK